MLQAEPHNELSVNFPEKLIQFMNQKKETENPKQPIPWREERNIGLSSSN